MSVQDSLEITPFTEEEIKIIMRGRDDFVYFVNNIFSKSSKHFIGGEHVDNTARFLATNQRTIRVSARNHFKSYAFYAHIMHKIMYELPQKNIETHYFSFNAELAGYHISKVKSNIAANPFFRHLLDKKSTAQSVIRYTWDNKTFITIEPHGLIQFKRGIHCDYVYVDDPFQDPENELNPAVIHKVNEIFKSNILDMPNEPDGELHCAGTPQTDEDFFFDKELTTRFAVKVLPAITEDGTALWKEWMDIPELEQKRKERTDRIFQREYLCTPVYSSEGFFKKDVLKATIVNPDLVMWKGRLEYKTENEVIAGFDIGKKSHPSHLSVFELKDGLLRMVHHKWMDGWSYSNGKKFMETSPTQLEYLKMVINNFKIKTLHYDNTRGEFEAFDEQGLLPRQMVPIVFNIKMKNSMATSFDKLVERKQLVLPDDDRLLDQICAVRNDLQAIQSSKGHGDAFWSVGLALMGVPDLIEYEEEEREKQVRKISVGQASIFSSDSPIPAGW